MGLAECGTHALLKVSAGACSDGEQTLAGGVVDALKDGMLCLADRGLYSFSPWNRARGTGAELLWRMKSNQRLPVLERFPDGSWRTEIFASDDRKRQEGVSARAIEYTVEDPSRASSEARCRLLTTILDPERAPAQELAPLYPQRRELESTLDELDVHQRGPRIVLRSKLPDLVTQELYGHLCVHYAIRWLMHAVALEGGHDPDRVSFTHAIRVARRTTGSHPGFSPRALRNAHRQAKAELLHGLLPSRRLRTDPHVVKRKMSGCPVKRAEHRNPPKPTRRPQEATVILAAEPDGIGAGPPSRL